MTYTVTEAAVAGFANTGKLGDTGTITTAKSEAKFTNTRETGDLAVTKTVVSGIDADKDIDFSFTVKLVDNPIAKDYPIKKTSAGSGEGVSTSDDEETEPAQELIRFTDGVATFVLKHGETLTITGLPTDVEYTVVESVNPIFDTEATGNNGTISTTPSTAAFTNTRNQQPVSIWKTDTDYRPLTGAVFALYEKADYDENGTNAELITSGTVDENSLLQLGSLAVGVYSLVETKAPAGYNLAESAITITVTPNGVTAMQGSGPAVVEKKGDPHWVVGQDDATWQVRVWNTPGVTLPHTGGIGTAAFTAGGLALIALALFLLMKKRLTTEA